MVRRLILLSTALLVSAVVMPMTPASAQARCTPGARVAAASYGHWYAATVVGPTGGKCTVHYDRFSSSSDEAVTPDNLGPIGLASQYDAPAVASRPATTGGTTAGTRAARLVPAAYRCASFVGPVTGGGHMIPMPDITILGNGTYRHANGGVGRIGGGGGTLEFHGGPLDGQAATYDAGPTGRGTLHLYNARRSRTVIDCDG